MSSARPGEQRRAGGGARQVALGILTSRLAGLVREKLFAYFFGVGAHADVFRAALRAPNLLQNLLGEQTLSAAFIPIYSRLLGAGRSDDAGRFAGAIFGLLTAVVAVLVAAGVLLARPLVALLVPGFVGDAAAVAAGEMTVDRFELTVAAARWIFPMTGLLVLSAWALGVLNSHRRFFLPYFAPVLWNAAIVGGLLIAIPWGARDRWLMAACIGALVGGALQFGVQLPLVLQLVPRFRPSLSLRMLEVRESLRALGPALAGRGAVQLSLYLDQLLASLLAAGAVGAIGWAGLIAGLPLAVFGSSVAAAELPELAREDSAAGRGAMARRIDRGVRQSAFVLLPATIGFFIFGLLVVGLLLEGGQFGREDAWLVTAVLWGYTLGLPASTLSRLLQNTFYALGDTRTPARVAFVRVLGSAALGWALMVWLDRYTVAAVFGLEGAGKGLFLGALGLSLAAGVVGWVELWLLRRALCGALPELRLPAAHLLRRLLLALGTALPAAGVWWGLGGSSTPAAAVLVLGVYGVSYLGVAWWWRLDELGLWLGRLGRR